MAKVVSAMVRVDANSHLVAVVGPNTVTGVRITRPTPPQTCVTVPISLVALPFRPALKTVAGLVSLRQPLTALITISAATVGMSAAFMRPIGP